MPSQQHNNVNDNKIRVLVLGENKQGKSSVVDLLLRRDADKIPWDEVRTSMFNYFILFLFNSLYCSIYKLFFFYLFNSSIQNNSSFILYNCTLMQY